MKKKIEFSKSVEITIELKEKKEAVLWTDFSKVQNVLSLSIYGAIWDRKRNDMISGGQNIDEIAARLPKNKTVQRIFEIWKQYHLNDMNAGSQAQTEFLNEWQANGNKYEYGAAKQALKDAGLEMDKGYIYGSVWLFQPIPENIIDEIKTLLADES